jgi:hypothetical protein
MNSTVSTDSDAPKKPYDSPRLVVYGDIRVLTKAVDSAGATDGGVHASMSKT